jgi:DNA-binding NtrC family response regulator
MTMSNEPSRMSLLVMSKVGVFTYPVPASGEVTIGRAADCHVRVDDPKASRYHARLKLGAGAVPRLVDQSSANGTFVAGRRLEPGVEATLAVGEMVTIGATVLVLQSSSANSPVRVWSQAAFEARLAEERARTGTPGHAVVRLMLDAGAVSSSAATTRAQMITEVARAEVLDRTLCESLRTTDVIGSLAPGLYHVLLIDVGSEEAERIGRKLEAALRAAAFDARVEVDWHHTGEALTSVPQLAAPPAGSIPANGTDPAMIDRIAASAINVLILGDTGVGKEVMARRLHERSPRADAPLLCLNCAALSESLLESELFGYERGAFTGATQSKPGLLESAQGGTVFLDEVGEMPLTLQAKLLRVLEQREVLRIGALKPRPIDVRFLSATNRDLEAEIGASRFRRDLYFRLNGISIAIPPLRERVHEIEPLARAFVAEACAQSRRGKVPDLSPAALALLKRYAWPGNIRELRNAMERAVVLCAGDVIGLEHLPADKMAPVVELGQAPSGREVEALAALYGSDPEAERARILDALTECRGNQTQAATRLGISRRTLVTKLGQYNLPRPRKKP